jgi:hypothetical protein
MQGPGLFLSAGFWLVQVGKKVNYPSMLPPTENRCVNLGCSAEASEWVDCTPGRASRIVPNCRSGNVKRRDWSKQNRTTPGHTHSLSSSLSLSHPPLPPPTSSEAVRSVNSVENQTLGAPLCDHSLFSLKPPCTKDKASARQTTMVRWTGTSFISHLVIYSLVVPQGQGL